MQAGDKLGTYEVLAKIGEGGMGEVYRAHDTKLKRDVALKVLPAAFARDPERMARFQREAQVLASLNHPNIAAIYGVEESSGTHALVMEFVEGESLQALAKRGALSLEEAWKLCSQIAGALEYAHEKGVIHRDLKPANVMVTSEGATPSGVVKLLDFGLAKALAPVSASNEKAGIGEDSPTISMALTDANVILGTAGYMSPEQVRGKNVDKRADIWAFGVVLYELVTGERLFKGEDAAETLAQVLTKQPDFDKAPQQARALLRECLQKDPRNRLRDIGDANRLIEIAKAMEGGPEPARDFSPAAEQQLRTEQEAAVAARATAHAAQASAAKAKRGRLIALAAAAIFAIAAAALSLVAYRATRPAELKSLVRLDVDLGLDGPVGSTRGTDVILSPDGGRVVYISKERLYTRKLDQPVAAELVGTEGATEPFFSPDGRWVAFFAGGKLKKISVEGSAPEILCEASDAAGGTWSEDGTIIAALTPGALWRIPSTGGAPMPLIESPGVLTSLTTTWPQVLPGGNAVLVTSSSAAASSSAPGSDIEVVSLSDKRRKVLQKGGTFGRYLPTGHLVYLNNGTMYAVPFSLESLAVHGTPVPMLTDVSYSNLGFARFDYANNGTLVYRSGGKEAIGFVTVQWLDREGTAQPLLASPGNYRRPHLSPNGQQLAIEIPGSLGDDIWIYEWGRNTMRRLTFDAGGVAMNPVWSPDSRYIVFGGKKGGLFWIRADGARKPEALTQSENVQVPFSLSPDGKRLSFMESTAQGSGNDLFTVPVEISDGGLRGGKPENFLRTPFDERQGVFSPDGRWLAYTSNESGTYQIYVRSFPDNGGKWQISITGGSYPIWSRNGRELLFRSGDNRIMVATYNVKGDSIMPNEPRLWSAKYLADFGAVGFQSFDVAPDGTRVAALMSPETPKAQQSRNQVIFLQNFSDELRRRVPVK